MKDHKFDKRLELTTKSRNSAISQVWMLEILIFLVSFLFNLYIRPIQILSEFKFSWKSGVLKKNYFAGNSFKKHCITFVFLFIFEALWNFLQIFSFEITDRERRKNYKKKCPSTQRNFTFLLYSIRPLQTKFQSFCQICFQLKISPKKGKFYDIFCSF